MVLAKSIWVLSIHLLRAGSCHCDAARWLAHGRCREPSGQGSNIGIVSLRHFSGWSVITASEKVWQMQLTQLAAREPMLPGALRHTDTTHVARLGHRFSCHQMLRLRGTMCPPSDSSSLALERPVGTLTDSLPACLLPAAPQDRNHWGIRFSSPSPCSSQFSHIATGSSWGDKSKWNLHQIKIIHPHVLSHLLLKEGPKRHGGIRPTHCKPCRKTSCIVTVHSGKHLSKNHLWSMIKARVVLQFKEKQLF